MKDNFFISRSLSSVSIPGKVELEVTMLLSGIVPFTLLKGWIKHELPIVDPACTTEGPLMKHPDPIVVCFRIIRGEPTWLACKRLAI